MVDTTAADTSGRGKQTDVNQYETELYTFPSDLFGAGAAEKYAHSWVMIYINARTNSKYNKDYRYVKVPPRIPKAYGPASRENTLGGKGSEAAVAAGGALIAAIPSVAAQGSNVLGQFLSGNGSAANIAAAAGKVAGDAAKGAAAGAFAGLPFLTSNGSSTTQRISTAISLPMPNQLSTNYTASWSETDTAILNAALRIGGQVTQNKIKEAFANSEVLDAANALSLGTQNALGSGAISAATGIAYNPKKELQFQGMAFRQFSLDYKFYPKNARDQANLYYIINKLKFHMHPEYKSEGRYTWIFPDEFEVVFHVGDDNQGGTDVPENYWIHRTAACVLKSMTVNYTPDGLWAAKELFWGAPNAVNISLQFQEIIQHTKETIELGF